MNKIKYITYVEYLLKIIEFICIKNNNLYANAFMTTQ